MCMKSLFYWMILPVALAGSGCRSTEAPDAPGSPRDPEAFMGGSKEDAVEDKPSFAVEAPGGARLLFFADDDGSVGVLGEVPDGSERGSAIDHPELQEATPAMIYFAVTGDDSEIPEALVAHHEGLAREAGLPRLEVALEGRERGWLLADPNPQFGSPCSNATFTVNHCGHSAYDEAFCKKNTSASWNWYVPGADRYKAGFCLQQGQAQSWLYYQVQGANCTYFQPHYIWGFNSALFDEEYSATTYRSWVWWRGAGSPRRLWYHFGGNGSGDVFDWGQRYSWESCS